tara:strand:+ start:4111 stop:5526 length:1416 start_codon:yes stop_codon:yes gene_type:complete
MEQLPESLIYFTKRLTNYSVNTVKLQSLNTQKLASNGATQLRVALPVNSIVNMKSFSMVGTVRTYGVAEQGGNSNTIYALIPRGGIQGLMDRISWSCGGIQLDNGTSAINLVQNTKNWIEKTNDKTLSDGGVLEQSYFEPIDPADAWAGTNQGQEKTLVANNFLGFTECEPTYLDSSRVPEMFATFQLANKGVLSVQAENSPLGQSFWVSNPNFTGTECEFEIDDIHFTIEVCSVGSGLYDAVVGEILASRGVLEVPYKTYQSFSTDVSSAGSSIRSSVSTMSLDKIYAFNRNNGVQYATLGDNTTVYPSAGATQFAQYNPWNIQQAPIECEGNVGVGFESAYFNKISQGISEWNFRVNNAPLPLFNVSPVEAYNFVVCGNDRSYSKIEGSMVGSQDTWLDNAFVAMVRLNQGNDPRLISGMDLSALNAQIAFNSTSNNADGSGVPRQLWLVTESTSVLRIGDMRAISVVN